MNNSEVMSIDLVKLAKHLLKYWWLIVLCTVLGFVGMYGYSKATAVDTYTASATMYVYNGNPNMVNYSYANSGDLSSAVQLLGTYKVVINSNKVMDVVVERLTPQYSEITAEAIIKSLNVGSVDNTGVMRISCTTTDPQMSADICNTVADVAPAEIIRVVAAGGIEVVDYAEVPTEANSPSILRQSIIGGVGGAALVIALLVAMFMLNQKVRDAKELESSYSSAVLAEIPRKKEEYKNQWEVLINEQTSANVLEAYNKLRMNLGFSMAGKRHILLVSSAVPGEGKSTIAANLAVTYARGGKHVLLIDGDLRRANQSDFFFEKPETGEYLGLSNLIIGEYPPGQVINQDVFPNMDVLLAGSMPPNPSELLSSKGMSDLLRELEEKHGYDIIIIDTPPINIVPDPLILSEEHVSMLYVVRQNYSDHREVRKAMASIEFAKMDLLGMVLYGENVTTSVYSKSKYYGKRYGYGKAYGKYYEAYRERSESVYGETGANQEKWELRSDKSKGDLNEAQHRASNVADKTEGEA